MNRHTNNPTPMQHIRAVVERYHVFRRPGSAARFSFSLSCIGVWCLPTNHPGGLWESFDFYRYPETSDNPSRAQELGDFYPILDADEHTITSFIIQTKALPLKNQNLLPADAVLNRPEDLRWAAEQLSWLWEQAFPGTPLPPVSVTDWQIDPSDAEDFADWVAANAARKPGEPLSDLPPAKNPRPF